MSHALFGGSVLAEFVLEPCQRAGAAPDWWTEPHRSCTGSEHVTPHHVHRCSCPCHSAQAVRLNGAVPELSLNGAILVMVVLP